jgi:hypothetical protein
MVKKSENCLYCGEKMDSKTAKKKFCSDQHRVYYNREKNSGTTITDLTQPTKIIEPVKPTGSLKTNFTIDTTPKKQMPPGLTLNQQLEWRIKNE